MSSAHVYLRMRKGQTIDDISEGLLEDCAQLVKANSIQGKYIYTLDSLTCISTFVTCYNYEFCTWVSFTTLVLEPCFHGGEFGTLDMTEHNRTGIIVLCLAGILCGTGWNKLVPPHPMEQVGTRWNKHIFYQYNLQIKPMLF